MSLVWRGAPSRVTRSIWASRVLSCLPARTLPQSVFVFPDFDIFEELFASYFCNVLYFRCLMFPHGPIQVMRFGQEHYTSEVSFPVHYIKRPLMLMGSITGDVDFDDVVQAASRLLCRKVTIFPLVINP